MGTLHIGRRDQFNLVAQRRQHTTPIVSGAASFDADQARPKLCKERYKILSSERLLDDDVASGVDRVDLESGLRQVNPDCGNLLHGRCSSDDVSDDNHHGTQMPP